MNWYTGEDYPYSAKLDGFDVISVSDFFVVFGGQISIGASNMETDIVAQYKSYYFIIRQLLKLGLAGVWSQIGSLQKARMGHSVIKRYRDEFWVVGQVF